MDYTLMLQDVRDHAGLASVDEAGLVTANVVARIGALLSDHDRHAMAPALARPLADALVREEPEQELPFDALIRRVAREGALPVGVALEHTHVVCQALARTLGDDVTEFLRARLPDDVADLLSADRPTMSMPPRFAPERVSAAVVGGNTLATGRPGSNHPVSESPFGLGHSGSVARAPNPHGDRKISSAGGPQRGGRGSTLARGKPGPTRPISEFDEP